MASMSVQDLTHYLLFAVNLTASWLAVSTLWKVVGSRQSLCSESLSQDNRRLLWRVVFFLIFPLSNALKAFATQSVVRAMGGEASFSNWGLYYYLIDIQDAQNWSTGQSLFALLSGEIVLFAFLLALLPVFLLRPNPWFSTLLGYATVFLFAYSLICIPVLSALGVTFGPWSEIASTMHLKSKTAILLGLNASMLFLVLATANLKAVRSWFSKLSRPVANERLQEVVSSIESSEISADSPNSICRLAHLYHLAGLTKESQEHLKKLNTKYGTSLYTAFLNATLAYHLKKFDYARKEFLNIANSPDLVSENKLKADLLAAASCASFAQGKARSAFRLCLKALQEDRTCLLAQLIKVDTLLATGKFSRLEMENHTLLYEVDPQKALDEIVPLDFNKTIDAIARIEKY